MHRAPHFSVCLRRLRSSLSVAALAYALSGCDQADRDIDPALQVSPVDGTISGSVAESRLGISIRDSSGVAVVEYDVFPSQGQVWTVDQVPQLSLGAGDELGIDAFGNVIGVTVIGDGQTVIADRASGELKSFESSGRHRWTSGGSGEGPGEFRNLTGVLSFGADSIIAWDSGSSRVSVFDVLGNYVRTIVLAGSVEIPLGIAGSSFINYPLGTLGDLRIVATPGPTPVLMTVVSERPQMLVSIHDATGELISQLGTFPWIERRMMDGGVRQVLLAPKTEVAVRGNRIAVGVQDSFEVLQYDQDGALKMVVRIGKEPVRFDEAMREKYIEHSIGLITVQEMVPWAVRNFESQPFTETLPAFDRILLDSFNYLWVQEYLPSFETQEPTWWVFNPEGEYVAATTFPSGFEPQRIDGSTVLGIRTDELGVEYVEARGIQRR